MGGKVATVDVTPSSGTIDEGETLQLTATPKDAAGNPMNRIATWTSLDTNVATVDNTGLVTGVMAGTVTIEASSGGATGTAMIAVQPVATVAMQPGLSASFDYACGLTPAGEAYCWGQNPNGQLGDGTTSPTATPVQVADPSAGPVVWASVSAGTQHVCGVTTDARAYCWGANASGQLGEGTLNDSNVPVRVSDPVAGPIAWRSVSAGHGYTCGLSTTGRAFCWGGNFYGMLGDGTTSDSSVPVAVAGSVVYDRVDPGAGHTCAITSAGDVHCWGRNDFGFLGDGTTTSSLTPVTVSDPASGPVVWASLAIGRHSCAVTSAGAAYCWGDNRAGELGEGTGGPSTVPVAVTGSLIFRSLSAGTFNHTCGVTVTDEAYCWGEGRAGQLGDGASTSTNAPVPVSDPASGPVSWESITAGVRVSCGMSSSGEAYCWGDGELGDGVTATSAVPVRVAAPF